VTTPSPLTPQPIPGSALVTMRATRRSLLRGAGIAGLALSSSSLLAACGGDSGEGSGGGSLKVGLNEAAGSGPAYDREKAIVDAYIKKSGTKVAINAVDHNTFQEQANSYLQGNPDDVFTWFAGFRMDQFAQSGLIRDVSDAWPIDGLNDSFKAAATASDGKQYFVPREYYPWAVFYNKKVWDQKGYAPPATFDEFKTLMSQMKKDGITPWAFGDKDGWPAMGTFDILNMRINGFDFHMNLMKGEEAWDSKEVKNVFDTWAGLLEFNQPDPLGRTWQEAATSMGKGECGMYLLGTFVIDAVPDQVNDIDMFNFPELDSAIGAGAIDAPIDGWCVSAATKNADGALDMMKWLGTTEAADAMNSTKVPAIAANENAATDNYSALQKKSVDLVGSAENIAQFMDRDTRADFASTVMIPAIQTFLKDPKDIDGVCKSIQEQKVSIFGS
jgi:multiple sugar transport system substrate-binding protein